MAFIFLCGVVGVARMRSSLDADVLFTDFENSDLFFDRYASVALERVQTVFGYQSEEHVRDMGCLEWQPTGRYYVEYAFDEDSATYETLEKDEVERLELDGDVRQKEEWLSLVSTNPGNKGRGWGQVRASDLESREAMNLLEEAIGEQLSEFYYAKEWLGTFGGLYYYIKDESRSLTNAPEQNAEYFRQQPVYMINAGHKWEYSRTGENFGVYTGYWENDDITTVYIAFSQEAVDYWNYQWIAAQRQLAANIGLMGGAALAALILLIILMAGAGRRYDSGEIVHFTVLDKPWLDFGLAVLIGYEVAISLFIYYSIKTAWRYDNIRWILSLCALLAVGFTLPLLGWLLSFTKRCKAEKWWRHTLLYWIYNKCRSFVKSLWAGVPLTVKAVLISLAALASMLITAAAPPMCLVFAAVIAIGLLRYARRLYLLEQGARAVAAGSYDAPIAVTDGELGSVAVSINRISEGINVAVAERMKSERLKTELITNVSHDIRTPLTSLITYADLLKSEGLDSEKAPEYLEVLIQKSARLKTLTDDLFEASKAASGSIEVHLGPLDLADFVRQVLGELDERVSASGLDFRLNLPEHAQVRADGRLLWRVMENLLSNVFKYALNGSRVYIDVLPENGDWRLEVKNISENALNVDPAELTERFKRGDSARTDEGSGLGLSIAQSFVQAQGGRFALSIDGDLFKAVIVLPKDRQKERIA